MPPLQYNLTREHFTNGGLSTRNLHLEQSTAEASPPRPTKTFSQKL